jgi:hypothetical protein
MTAHGLIPGVKDGGESQPGAETIVANLEEGLGARVEECVKGGSWSATEEWVQRLGNGKHDMKVLLRGNQVVLLHLGPKSLIEDSAASAVAIAA